MYNLYIRHTLGSFVKDESGKIYEITKISIDIEFSEIQMQDIMLIKYEGVDARDPWGEVFKLNPQDIFDVSDAEVDDYIFSRTIGEIKDYKKQRAYDDDLNINISEMIDKIAKRKENVQKTLEETADKPTEESSINDLLDKYNDYRALIEMFGNDEYYAEKLKEVEEQIQNEMAK